MFALSPLPKVTVIIPTYNRAALIKESIRSVLNQTYSNWELIIIDDGSEDGTEDLINSIADERIRYMNAGRTGIVGRLKNRGIKESNGELIAFLDSDDLWPQTKLEKQVRALQQNRDAGFCLTNGYNFKDQETIVEQFYTQTEGSRKDQLFLPLFNSEVAAYTQALIFHKTCIHICGLFKEKNSFSDVDFIIRLSYHFPGIILYEPLLYRRLHQDNYIHDNTWEKSYFESMANIREYRKLLPVKEYRKAMFSLLVRLGEKYIDHGKTVKAIRSFSRSWPYRPASIIPGKKIIKAIYRYFS